MESPSGKKVKFNLVSVIELSETAAFCVLLCIYIYIFLPVYILQGWPDS